MASEEEICSTALVKMIHTLFLAVLKIPCVRHEIKAHSGVTEDGQSDHFSGPYKQDGGRTLSVHFFLSQATHCQRITVYTKFENDVLERTLF